MTRFEVTKGWFKVRKTDVVVGRVTEGTIRIGQDVLIDGKMYTVLDMARDMVHGEDLQLAVTEA